jgi:SAM-dependent methyltransferase
MPVLARSRRSKYQIERNKLAKRFLRGSGIEIGALSSPVPIPNAEVSYYDCHQPEALAELYPDSAAGLVTLAGVENIETLSGIDDCSQDFVVACRVLEYCSDVLAAFHALSRVLKPGGILLLSVCDKRHTHERHRPATPLGHLAADYVHGPAGSLTGHIQEWATFNPRFRKIKDPAKRLEMACANASRMRLHLWTPSTWLDLLIHIQSGLAFELESLSIANHEMLTVLRKV